MSGVRGLGLLCLLLLVLAVPLLMLDLTALVSRQRPDGRGAFAAGRVTIREYTLGSVSAGAGTAADTCVFVADLESSTAGWVISLPHSGSTAGHLSYVAPQASAPPNDIDSMDALDALTSAALRTLMATRVSGAPTGRFTESPAGEGWARLELAEGRVELLVTYPAPHRPIRARVQEGGRARELYFIPDLVEDLPAHEEQRLEDDLRASPSRQDYVVGEGALCRWAGELDEELWPTSVEGLGKRQTEVIVVNRRKKHRGGNGAKVAIGLGVGLGVGIPVVVLLALIPCVIALWLIRKRRRGSRTIRVADVPTGVFATGQPESNPTYQEEEPDYQESDLQSTLGENY